MLGEVRICRVPCLWNRPLLPVTSATPVHMQHDSDGESSMAYLVLGGRGWYGRRIGWLVSEWLPASCIRTAQQEEISRSIHGIWWSDVDEKLQIPTKQK